LSQLPGSVETRRHIKTKVLLQRLTHVAPDTWAHDVLHLRAGTRHLGASKGDRPHLVAQDHAP
jgi:hypothetical protein